MDIGQAIHQLPLGVFLRSNPIAYPVVESLHLMAMAVLFGSVLMVDVRILGASRALPLRALARHALPWTMLAFVGVVATGALLFVAHAAELIGNRIFLLKLGLITLAGTNAAMFHPGPFMSVAEWDSGVPSPPAARLMAGASIAIWLGVILCGRWIAYA